MQQDEILFSLPSLESRLAERSSEVSRLVDRLPEV